MKSSQLGNRGGRRENAGRKAIWNNKDTTTIRVPKVIATQVIEIAHRLDSIRAGIDFVSKSIPARIELVTESKNMDLENITDSNSGQIEIVKKSIRVPDENVAKSNRSVNEAIGSCSLSPRKQGFAV